MENAAPRLVTEVALDLRQLPAKTVIVSNVPLDKIFSAGIHLPAGSHFISSGNVQVGELPEAAHRNHLLAARNCGCHGPWQAALHAQNQATGVVVVLGNPSASSNDARVALATQNPESVRVIIDVPQGSSVERAFRLGAGADAVICDADLVQTLTQLGVGAVAREDIFKIAEIISAPSQVRPRCIGELFRVTNALNNQILTGNGTFDVHSSGNLTAVYATPRTYPTMLGQWRDYNNQFAELVRFEAMSTEPSRVAAFAEAVDHPAYADYRLMQRFAPARDIAEKLVCYLEHVALNKSVIEETGAALAKMSPQDAPLAFQTYIWGMLAIADAFTALPENREPPADIAELLGGYAGIADQLLQHPSASVALISQDPKRPLSMAEFSTIIDVLLETLPLSDLAKSTLLSSVRGPQ